MSNSDSNLPPAGWYPNPADGSQSRWWDGSAWTEHTKIPDPVLASIAGIPITAPSDFPSSVNPGGSAQQTAFYPTPHPGAAARARNGLATAALIFGIVAVLVALFTQGPGALLGVAAIVLGAVGASRGARVGTGKPRAIWGITLGATAVGIGMLVNFVTAATGVLGDASPVTGIYDKAEFEATILADLEDQTDMDYASVECPVNPTVAEDAEFQCVAKDPAGQNLMIDVRIQDDSGSFTWQVAY